MRPHRGKFLAIRLALAVVAVAAIAIAYVGANDPRPVHVASATGRGVPKSDWGHVRASDGMLAFMLGPAEDQRRRYELPFGRVMFRSARLFVADDDRGTNSVEVPGEIEGGGCTLHFQGSGVNAQMNVGKCVPVWAQMPDGTHAGQWIRVENLVARARVVLLVYPPM